MLYRRNSRRANRKDRKNTRKNRKNSRRASRKNSRRANRKNSRRANRRNSRRNNTLYGGRRRNMSRKNRGVFSTIYAPASNLIHAAKNVTSSGLNTAYRVPATFVKGAKNTVRNSVSALASGVNNIGQKATHGVDRALSRAFSRKGRRNSRNSRRNH